MSSILNLPRTITLCGQASRFESFDSLTGLADAYVRMLQGAETRMATKTMSDAEWTEIADAADALAEICQELESWLAEHDAALAVEAEAIRADIRRLTPLTAHEGADEQV